MNAEDLDKLFDSGEVDITPYLELSKGHRPDQEQKRLNVDFPPGLSPERWHQYEELEQKRLAETLTEAEHQTLIEISNQIEEANARRIESLAQLALLRNVSLDTLMADLQITTKLGR